MIGHLIRRVIGSHEAGALSSDSKPCRLSETDRDWTGEWEIARMCQHAFESESPVLR